jgi:hypothetical protein
MGNAMTLRKPGPYALFTPLLATLLLAACGGSSSNQVAGPANATVRIVHSSPDALADGSERAIARADGGKITSFV